MFIQRILSLVLTCSVVFYTIAFGKVSAAAERQAPTLSAESAIVMCADNGAVLFEKNADRQMAIASITKIMTALIALEYVQVNDRAVCFTEQMTAEGSSMYLKPGDTLRLSELVKGLMAVSGNDAANALAVGIAGSKENFAMMMNQKAALLGMTHTHFVTPSGLDDDNHYSTARDMALLCCYAMDQPQFARIVSQQSLTVSFVSPEGKQQYCKNHNRLLSLYPGCIGIKTGFTKKAGRTLTSCAEKNGVRLIAVTLNAPDDWNDHAALFDFGFSGTEQITPVHAADRFQLPVAGGECDTVTVKPSQERSLTRIINDPDSPETVLYLPRFIYAPVPAGTVVGEAVIYYKKKRISVSLVTADAVRMQKEDD